jgi:hypothetical protein
MESKSISVIVIAYDTVQRPALISDLYAVCTTDLLETMRMSVALAGKAKEHRHASQLSTPSSHCFLV